MTANDFRKLALSLADTTESAHMDHPDFRVGGKIFATLGYPDTSWAMVSLPPIDQDLFIQADPLGFAPVKGAWSKQGATNVRLSTAKKALVKRALSNAHAWARLRGARGRPASSTGALKAATTSHRSRPPATPSRRRR